eukprot:Gregarina_sp_Poly_1__2628@NODE_1716_length_3477_cov_67_613490_g50_i4_p1_GENE_NODE_1716_length_3477_cov_67_613490_g50_i4NODE_1716_length_3477_cov_67_613490_g50_i4_p1_ORF_typecomplete_len138_score9_64_NODE_1716_length_3477_cov_67_613490_g50_i4419832
MYFSFLVTRRSNSVQVGNSPNSLVSSTGRKSTVSSSDDEEAVSELFANIDSNGSNGVHFKKIESVWVANETLLIKFCISNCTILSLQFFWDSAINCRTQVSWLRRIHSNSKFSFSWRFSRAVRDSSKMQPLIDIHIF